MRRTTITHRTRRLRPNFLLNHPLHNGEFAGLIEHLQFRTAELKLRQRPLFKFAQLFGRYQTIEREERAGRDSAHAIPRPVGRRQNRWRIRPWRARAGTHAPDEKSHAMIRLIICLLIALACTGCGLSARQAQNLSACYSVYARAFPSGAFGFRDLSANCT